MDELELLIDHTICPAGSHGRRVDAETVTWTCTVLGDAVIMPRCTATRGDGERCTSGEWLAPPTCWNHAPAAVARREAARKARETARRKARETARRERPPTVAERLAALFSPGAVMTVGELVRQTDATAGTIRVTLSRSDRFERVDGGWRLT